MIPLSNEKYIASKKDDLLHLTSCCNAVLCNDLRSLPRSHFRKPLRCPSPSMVCAHLSQACRIRESLGFHLHR